MVTIKEVKSELRNREWAEQIQECQTGGHTVKEWCKSIDISPSTYYHRLKTVCKEMLFRQSPLYELVPVSIFSELTASGKTHLNGSSFLDKPKNIENIIIQKTVSKLSCPVMQIKILTII